MAASIVKSRRASKSQGRLAPAPSTGPRRRQPAEAPDRGELDPRRQEARSERHPAEAPDAGEGRDLDTMSCGRCQN